VEVPATGGRKIHLPRDGEYFQGVVAAAAGDDYWYWLDGTLRRPDPASRCQPQGVHGPSRIIDPTFAENEGEWSGIALAACIFYELHIGTFTPAGTFDAAIDRLAYLRELGVTALQIMPVAQFPGERNWGYDGVYPFAPQQSYGGAAGLKRFVAACHRLGLAVFLDVVYNHLGPEGNYLHAFGPYFTDRYRTPWGDAINFDGPDSDGVRHYFIANACYWLREYHLDGLRLDAVHGIYDFSARHILAELAEAVQALAAQLGRSAYVIAESDLNDPRLVTDNRHGGYGLDAQWCDDFHHALRALLTGDRDGYFSDFGDFSHLVKSFRKGFVLAGGYSSYRRRRHGSSSAEIPPGRLLVFSQNHDQVGNRMRGERLSEHLSLPQLKLAAATVLLSPYLPLLFMGEEYAETAPFPYFISHGDQELVAAVRQGRAEEFAGFARLGRPPDPQSEATFLAAKLDPEARHRGDQRRLFSFYVELIRLRKECPPLARLSREEMQIVADEEEKVLAVMRRADSCRILCLFNYSDQNCVLRPPLAAGILQVLLDSAGDLAPGSRITVDTARPETFPTLAPFGVIVYRQMETFNRQQGEI
jgi:maltooligosyltrehalose trehalohydrolase